MKFKQYKYEIRQLDSDRAYLLFSNKAKFKLLVNENVVLCFRVALKN